MTTLAEARSLMVKSVVRQLPVETISLESALGRVTSNDIVSTLNIPPADNSAMDGFAINSKDCDELPASFSVSQRIPAGVAPLPLQAGTAARIFTGGLVPEGADAVVIQENTEFDSQSVTLRAPAAAGDNIRPCGQDIEKGAVVVRRGQRLTAIDMSLLASIGIAEVSVISPLKVAIFSTGDELVEPGEPLKPGQIYNSNRVLLMALCRQLGFVVLDQGIVADNLEATKQALARAADQADVIISSGGVSVGEEDHVKPAVESLGELNLWKIQMKPGKPVAYGTVANSVFIGLPGNPVSSYVIFQLLAAPLLKTLQGELFKASEYFSVKSGFSKPTSSREEYIRVRLLRNELGELVADRFENLSSGVMSSLSWADGLARQSIDQAIAVGESLDFFPLHEGRL